MALQPLWLQEVDYPARWDRILFDNIWTAGTLGPSSFAVTQSGSLAMTVDVSAGVAIVTGTDQSFQGKYMLREEAATTGLSITAAPGSGQRNDIIALQVRDTNAGGAAGDDAVIVVVTGTPSGSPVDPALPASSLALARVRVPAGTGSITNSLIDDLRVEAVSEHEALSVPVGTIIDSIATTAPSGWVILDGSTISGGQSLYPLLWSVLPASFKSGSDIILPDLRGRVTVMQDSGTFATLGSTGGAQTHTLTTSEMPSHTHTQNSHNHTQNSHTHSINHGHSVTDPGHSHQIPAVSGSGGDLGFSYSFSGGIVTRTTFTNVSNVTVNNHTGSSSSTTAVNVATTAVNQDAGGGAAHNNLQPYIVFSKMMRVG